MSAVEPLAATEWAASVPPDQQGPAVLAMMRGEGDPTSTDSWGPLRLAEKPPAPAFPLDVLPPPARHLAVEASRSIGCPVDYLATAMLGVAAGTIGRSASLRLKPGYFAPSSLYIAIVGPASDGKSSAVGIPSDPVRLIDRELAAEYVDAIVRWKRDCETPGPDGKKRRESELPPRPRPRRIDVDNMTLEKLPILLRDNPRGIVMVKDELSGLLRSFGQYKGGRGDDREMILTVWAGKPLAKDRVGDDNGVPTRVPHPCLSIVGGTTPGNLPMFVDPARPGDGFAERFLFCVPEPGPVSEDWNAAGVSDSVTGAWTAVVDRLWERPMDGDSPHVLHMDSRAAATWESRFKAHRQEMNAAGFNPALRGVWGKMDAQAGRLALVLRLVDHASDPTADPLAVPTVAERHIVNAWDLVDRYFKPHAVRALAGADPTGAGPLAVVANAVVEWIRAGRIATFTERDVYRARTWIGIDDLTTALCHLVKMNAVRPLEAPPHSSKGGRRPSPSYEANPALWSGRN